MSIEHSQILACFCTTLAHSFSERSGPGPLGPVRKILVVRSGPEGPQFARSVGTLLHRSIDQRLDPFYLSMYLGKKVPYSIK